MSLSVMKSKIAPLPARCVFVQRFIKDSGGWGHLLNVSQFSNFLMESNLISESGPLLSSDHYNPSQLPTQNFASGDPT